MTSQITAESLPFADVTLSPSLPFTDFTLFANLPAELQFKIWKLSLEENRIVMVRFPDHSRTRKHDFVSTIPALLHVSRSSRQEGLRYYDLSLVTRHSLNKAYFNSEKDVLMIETNDYGDKFGSFVQRLLVRDKIQPLAVNCLGLMVGRHLPSISAIFQLPKLKESVVYRLVQKCCCKPGRSYEERSQDCNTADIAVKHVMGEVQNKLFVDEEKLRYYSDQHPGCSQPVK